MTNEEIRKRYERSGGQLGKNDIAIDTFINMLHKHENSTNPYVKGIIKKFENFEKMCPNFTIFQSDKETSFMHQFNALQISTKNDDLVMSHEFGHALLGITKRYKHDQETSLNNNDLSNYFKKLAEVHEPENFEQIVKNARAHAVSPKNKEIFINYIEYLCDKNELRRTQAEKGPVSDIISSIFQYPSLTFASTNKKCVLPSFHTRDYYYDEEKKQMKTDRIFDENFANFYALVANNCEKELTILRNLFGEEWMQCMMSELENVHETFELANEKATPSVEDQIKQTIINVRESDISLIISEPIIQKDEDERRRIK